MTDQKTFLVFGATGQTGRHFVSVALREGHKVRALVRDPAKLVSTRPELTVHEGSIEDVAKLDGLVKDADFVISMLGNAEAQKHANVNTAFVSELVPAMRKHGVKRFLYQAGGFSAPPGQRLSPILRLIRGTIARGHLGQHRDNEAVMQYLADEANDIEWMVHRAALNSDGPSRGILERSTRRISVATFADCAEYNYRLLQDASAIHACDFSRYGRV